MGSYQLCTSSAECPNGEPCAMGIRGLHYCATPRGDGGGFMFDGGRFMRDAAMGDVGAPTDGATSSDGPTE
jgi:hypothetical protein